MVASLTNVDSPVWNVRPSTPWVSPYGSSGAVDSVCVTGTNSPSRWTNTPQTSKSSTSSAVVTAVSYTSALVVAAAMPEAATWSDSNFAASSPSSFIPTHTVRTV
ncbi:MAG: hypothetical protein J07HB67_02665 [halophilic archaeon J07HB67]|nr:MAG: hypothetical protein J07HB67_02665 [halophilic archaeon J07HB67]